MRKSICFLLAVSAAGAAAAQEKRPDPRDPKADAPRVEYRSAFEAYRPYAEPELASWRAANERVAGGKTESPREPGGAREPREAQPGAHGGHK